MPPGSPLPGQRVLSHMYCSTRGNELQAKISTLLPRVLIRRIKHQYTISEFTHRRKQAQRKTSFYQPAFFFVFFKHFQYTGSNFLRIPFVLVTEALQPLRCKNPSVNNILPEPAILFIFLVRNLLHCVFHHVVRLSSPPVSSGALVKTSFGRVHSVVSSFDNRVQISEFRRGGAAGGQ